ncbi:MAG: hypothetical protein KA746_03010 [Pyrinomonadaceae bacterium]|nr:hypothetical protein [Pyrinomonadaceae bacterium]MBP6212846.1 hypothetical protein [Pyrinomonadaceae bacterium]
MRFVVIISGILGFFTLLFIYMRVTTSYFRNKNRFGNSKLVSVLLGLDDESVERLLQIYKLEFGPGPARYARRTYQKWKSGKVQPAQQTYERFLVHLPSVMSYDMKCDILRHFMKEYSAKDDYHISVTIDDWEEKLTPLVNQIIEKAYTAELPIEIERKLRWLGDGDMQAAQKLLRASQAAEGKLAVSMLQDEFANIGSLFAAEGLRPKVRHELKFPYGTIKLDIKRR